MNRILEEMRFMIIIIRNVGLKFFLKQLIRQTFSISTEIGFTLDLTKNNIPEVKAKIPYSLRLASKEDMDELLHMAKAEDKEAVYHFIMQKWRYENGYHNYYIAKTIDTNEICFVQSIIYPEDVKMAKGRFKHMFPSLKEGEAIIESSYTFKKYRGNGLQPAITTDSFRLCKEQGLKRMIGHVIKDNIASIKGNEKAGFRRFEEVSTIKFLSIFRWERHTRFN